MKVNPPPLITKVGVALKGLSDLISIMIMFEVLVH